MSDPAQPPNPPAEKDSPWSLASVVAAAAIAIGVMISLAARPETDFEDAALGKTTTSIFARRGGEPIHTSQSEELPTLVGGVSRRAAGAAVLWLGNSQLHAINQAESGDEPASAKLHDAMLPAGVDVVSVSYPNANLQEHFLTVAHLAPKISSLRAIVLPLVFDDLRETGIREKLLDLLSDEETATQLGASEAGLRLLEQRPEATPEEAADADLAGLQNTFQERTEKFLNEWLEQNWAPWAARKEARGRFFIELYKFRNRALGIDSQTKRPLIQPRYEANHDALVALLDSAENAGVPVLMYVAPLRMDVETPYVQSEYQAFKEEAQRIAEERPIVVFKNLEGLVPASDWGSMASTSGGGEEIDFMHFQEPGHKLLAERIGLLLEEILAEGPAE